MKKILILILWFLCISCSSCSKEEVNVKDIKDERGIYTSKRYLWHLPLGDMHIGSRVKMAVIYKDLILMASEGKRDDGSLDDDDYIVAVNIYSGKIEWRVKSGDRNNDFNAVDIYQYGKYVVIKPYGSRIYCIDMERKEVIWNKANKDLDMNNRITGIENKFFVSAGEEGEYKSLYEGDVKTGELKLLLKAEFPHDGSEHIIKDHITKEFYGYKQVFGYRNDMNELMLLTFIRNSYDGKNDYIGLYNYNMKKWKYRYTKAESVPSVYLAKLYKGRVYYRVRRGFICYDIETGEKIWRTKENYKQSFRGFAIDEGKLIAANGEDMLVCFDLETGKKIWATTEGMGGNNPSKLYILNGIVYFTQGSLHAVDIRTGEYKWRIYSPDKSFDRGAFFKREIWVVPGKKGKKGRIITSSYRSGICYEAIR